MRPLSIGDAITFAEEVDRIYLATPDVLRVVDLAGGKTVSLNKQSLPEAVVWNPWVDKSRWGFASMCAHACDACVITPVDA